MLAPAGGRDNVAPYFTYAACNSLIPPPRIGAATLLFVAAGLWTFGMRDNGEDMPTAKDPIDLADALSGLEARSSGIGKLSSPEASALDRFRQAILSGGGLPVSLDCRSQFLEVSEEDAADVILPLCNWLKGVAESYAGDAKGNRSQLVIWLNFAHLFLQSTLCQWVYTIRRSPPGTRSFYQV